MKYIIWTWVGVAILASGVRWLSNLISADTRFFVLPEVLRYQGALLLIVTGGLIAILVSRAGKNHKVISSLKQQHPEQPWMWRSDWVQSHSKPDYNNAIYTTIFALIWSLLTVPSFIAAIPKFEHDLVFMMVFGIGFPLIGIAMLIWQAVVWIKYFSAGKMYLQLKSLPARLGEHLDCELDITKSMSGVRYEGELACFNVWTKTTKTSNGYKSRVMRDELWRSVVQPTLTKTSTGINLNMGFEIPDSEKPTDYKRDQGIKWYVLVRAVSKSGKKRFEREFQVPVFESLTPDDSSLNGDAVFNVPAVNDGCVIDRSYSK